MKTIHSFWLAVLVIIVPLMPYLTQGPFRHEIVILPIAGVSSVLLALWLTTKREKSIPVTCISISKADVLLSIGLIYAAIRSLITQEVKFIDELCILKWLAVAIIYVTLRATHQKSKIYYAIIVSSVIQSLIAISQKLGYVESTHPLFEITGSLGNPGQLAGYLVAGLVISVALFSHTLLRHKTAVTFLLFSTIIIATALYLADSRAALLALLIGLLFFFCQKVKSIAKRRNILVLLTVTISLLLLSIFLFNYRPSSANSRLLIWHVSSKMILDAPIWGHGIGSFDKEYMLYQANYFTTNPHSSFLMVADNATYPYNEMIHITVELGIVGLILFATAIVTLLLHPAKNQATRIAQAAFATCSTFALFSYPSYIPPLLINLTLLAGSCESKTLFTLRLHKMARTVGLSALIVCIIVFFKSLLFYQQTSLLVIGAIRNQAILSTININRCINNTSFGYYYATCIEWNQNLFADSLVKHLPPTCEIYSSYADIYAKQRKYKIAEYYYQKANRMIPTRLSPNYGLWQLYVMQGDTTKAIQAALHILEQPLKVENTFTIQAKQEVRTFLQQHPPTRKGCF